MSYKHNNLMAMRLNYWNDQSSEKTLNEKSFFQKILIQHDIFQEATLEDAEYFFFSLPSIIIVKGYALGFLNHAVVQMLEQHIDQNRNTLISRSELKIQYQMN